MRLRLIECTVTKTERWHCYRALLNGPIVWRLIRNKELFAEKSTEDPRKGSTWPTLFEWAEKKELAFDVTDFETKVRGMVEHGSPVQLVVRPDNWEKEDEEASESEKAIQSQ